MHNDNNINNNSDDNEVTFYPTVISKGEAMDILYEFKEVLLLDMNCGIKEIEDEGNSIDITDLVYTKQDILNALQSIIMLDNKAHRKSNKQYRERKKENV